MASIIPYITLPNGVLITDHLLKNLIDLVSLIRPHLSPADVQDHRATIGGNLVSEISLMGKVIHGKHIHSYIDICIGGP